jgi:DNA-binding response OmpR family regulator
MPYRRISTPLNELVRQLRETAIPCAIEAAIVLEAAFPDQVTQVLHVDLNTSRARRAGEEVKLSPNEAVMLYVMYNRPGGPTSAEKLADSVSGRTRKTKTHTIRQAIPILRRKVKRLGIDIAAWHGEGYSLVLGPITKNPEDV